MKRAQHLVLARDVGYFSRNNHLRRFLHLRRFNWLTTQLSKAGYRHVSVVELGCSNGRVIDMLETAGISVERYEGFDANWHGSLDRAIRKYSARRELNFTLCRVADEVLIKSPVQVGVCMETLEHVPAPEVDGYLRRLQLAVTDLMFITVPVERGVIFVAKHWAKRILGMDDIEFQDVSAREFWDQAFGRMDRVRRHEHRGFDDRALLRAVERYFEIIRIQGLFVPAFVTLNPTLGIICRPKGC